MLSQERANIEKRKMALENLMDYSEEYFTNQEKTAKGVKINTQLKTINQTVSSFKKAHG